MKEKIKIGIVTHYEVHNHGAQLQLFALLQILRAKGHAVYALRFEKDYRFMDSGAKNKYTISIKSVPYYIKYAAEQGLRKTLFNIRKKRIFDSFRIRNEILGEKHENFVGDLIIVGSDEVFSFETGVTDAFWGYGSVCKNVAAYSASFGPTTLNDVYEKGLNEYVTRALKNFASISARDSNSKEILETLGHGIVPLTCDPVILYGYKEELARCPKLNGEADYILLYSYDRNMNSENEISMIRGASKCFGLPVYSVGFYHSWCDKNINANPIELLWWFKNARYIITDTFHGSVLSLITESDFASFVRENANKLKNLLSEYGLENRIFNTDTELKSILKKQIDYKTINKALEQNRHKSTDYLEAVLGNAISKKEVTT